MDGGTAGRAARDQKRKSTALTYELPGHVAGGVPCAAALSLTTCL